jgi:predicted PurR-regulated permease PerM
MRGGWGKWLALVALAVVVWLTRRALTPFVVAGVLAYVLSPLVDLLQGRLKMRHGHAALLVFLALLAVLALGGWLLGARLVAEARAAAGETGPMVGAVERLIGGRPLDLFGYHFTAEELATRASEAISDELGKPGGALHAVQLTLELALKTLLALLTVAYLLVDGNRLGGFLLRFVPPEHREHAVVVSADIHRVLGRYLQGQLLLVVLMSIVTYVVLEWVFGLPHALLLGVLTGVLEVIPLIGPLAAGAIGSAVALAHGGPREAGLVALSYLLLRQAEDHLVMPQIVGRAVHVHPLATLFAVVAGEQLGGVLGALLAVPAVAAAKIVLDYTYPPLQPETHAARKGSAGGATAAPFVPRPAVAAHRPGSG